MKIGDLVKWRHPVATNIGVIAEVCENSYLVYWDDGKNFWHAGVDLEVI